MTKPTPDLKTLIRRLEKRHQKKQAATALIAGTAVLALTVFIAPLFAQEEALVLVQAPVPVSIPASRAFDDVEISGKAAIVYDLVTGETLYEKNSRSQLPLASLTKLLTVYAAAETLQEKSVVTISETALLLEGDSGLSVGESFTFGDLARLALVASSNDGAAAIAETASIARATTGRNLLAGAASAMGLSQTYALNGTGLDESTSVAGGYGSARDIALLSGALLTIAPDIARSTTEPSVTVRSREGKVHTLRGTNPGIVRVPNALLSKTGYTDLAGGNLAVVYDAGIGHPIAIVVLGSTIDGRFSDVNRLIQRTGEHFS